MDAFTRTIQGRKRGRGMSEEVLLQFCVGWTAGVIVGVIFNVIVLCIVLLKD